MAVYHKGGDGAFYCHLNGPRERRDDIVKTSPLRNFGLKPNFRISIARHTSKATYFAVSSGDWLFGIDVAFGLVQNSNVDAANRMNSSGLQPNLLRIAARIWE